MYIPYNKGIIETHHVSFDKMIKSHNTEIDFGSNKLEIIAGNEVPKRELSINDDTHDRSISEQDEGYTDKITVQEPTSNTFRELS